MRIESQAGVFGVRPQNLAVCGHFSLDGDTWAAVLRQLAGEGLGAAFDEVNLRSEEEDEDEDEDEDDARLRRSVAWAQLEVGVRRAGIEETAFFPLSKAACTLTPVASAR